MRRHCSEGTSSNKSDCRAGRFAILGKGAKAGRRSRRSSNSPAKPQAAGSCPCILACSRYHAAPEELTNWVPAETFMRVRVIDLDGGITAQQRLLRRVQPEVYDL